LKDKNGAKVSNSCDLNLNLFAPIIFNPSKASIQKIQLGLTTSFTGFL
jgi:hypothetical protein